MYYCERRGRGIAIRSSAQNMVFRRDCSYQRMLERCMEVYSDDERQNSEFYVADSRGVPIWSSDKITVDTEEGQEELEWTLIRHIKLSNVKYPSKAKYFCVRKELAQVDSVQGADDSSGSVEHTQQSHPSTPNQDSTIDKDKWTYIHQKKLDDTHFEAVYTLAKKSQYREAWSFITGLYQKRVLNEIDIEFHYDDDVDQTVIKSGNPCHWRDENIRVFFTGIDIFNDSDNSINLVESNNSEVGDVIYLTCKSDDSFGIWTGRLTYPQERVALLAAVVTGGHHPNSVYVWSKDGSPCEVENSPVIYATSKGLYVCTIETKSLNGVNITHKLEFIVRGSDNWTVDVPPPVLPVDKAVPQELPVLPKTADKDTFQSLGPATTSTVEACHDEIDDTVQCSDFTDELTDSDNVADRLFQEMSLLSLEEPLQLKLLQRVGEGGFGTVYRASWRGSVVAAKVIPIQGKLPSKEMDILKVVHHPNLSYLLGAKPIEGNKIALITPLVRGCNLHERLFNDNCKKLCIKDKILICYQLCQAVMFLHTNEPQMAHLNIKPANILIDDLTVHVTLTDFGLSKVLTETAQMGTRTMLAGSPGFQSPEQLKASGVGTFCDVYAVGGVIVVTFTEKPLWPSLTPFQIMCKVTVENAKPSTAELPSSLASVCNSCFNEVAGRPSIQVVFKGIIDSAKEVE